MPSLAINYRPCAAAAEPRESWIVTTVTASVSGSYWYTKTIQDHGPIRKRSPDQRPDNDLPISGNSLSTPSDRRTRSLVSAGSDSTPIICPRSSAAARLRWTRVTSQVFEWNAAAGRRLAHAKLRALERSVDAVEHGRD